MVKRIAAICFVFLFVCLITTSIFALNIKIKSIPDHRISLIIRESGKLSSLESFHQETGTGELTITSPVTADPLDIIVTLKKDGANLINRKYESVKNENLFLIFIPGDDKLMSQAEADAELAAKPSPTETTTETEASEENKKTTNEAEPTTETKTQEETAETETNDKLTTFALLDKLPVDSSLLVKIGVGLLVLIGAVVMIRVVPAFKREGTFTIKPLAKLKEEMSKTHVDKKVEEIEKKMKDLQSELDYVKNRDGRMKEIQERMKKDQEELRRLQGY